MKDFELLHVLKRLLNVVKGSWGNDPNYREALEIVIAKITPFEVLLCENFIVELEKFPQISVRRLNANEVKINDVYKVVFGENEYSFKTITGEVVFESYECISKALTEAYEETLAQHKRKGK